MDEKIIATFCLCDDLLKVIGHQESAFAQQLRRCRSHDHRPGRRLMLPGTTRLGSLHACATRLYPRHAQQKPLQSTPASTQRNRGIRLRLLGTPLENPGCRGVYVTHSFPVAVCDNIRIRRAKLYRDETYRGYQASKRRYFYGLKIHLMVTSAGQPVECVLTPGSVGDVQVLKGYAYDLPPGSVVYADKAYNDYEIEDLLAEVEDIRLLPIRKKNSKRPLSASTRFLQSYHRKQVETAGSLLMGLFPKSLHAVSAQGFELKVALFVLAYSFDCYLKLVGTL